MDADVEDCVDAGVHICIAAGNNSFKIADSTDPDYDNIIFWSIQQQLLTVEVVPFDTGAPLLEQWI